MSLFHGQTTFLFKTYFEFKNIVLCKLKVRLPWKKTSGGQTRTKSKNMWLTFDLIPKKKKNLVFKDMHLSS